MKRIGLLVILLASPVFAGETPPPPFAELHAQVDDLQKQNADLHKQLLQMQEQAAITADRIDVLTQQRNAALDAQVSDWTIIKSLQRKVEAKH